MQEVPMKKAMVLMAAAGLGAIASGADVSNQVKLETSYGDIVIALNSAAAPVTAANFLGYVDSGFYNGTIFHRVIPGFMIQGGGYDSAMTEKITQAPIKNEAGNGLKNDRGTIAMARTSDPNSATAQFFINLVDNGFLNHKDSTVQGWGYCVFGKVVKGMEVVDSIAKTLTARKGAFENVPVTPIVIKKASVVGEANVPAKPKVDEK
ncbi:MAG: peptidylprolyl isomerase [Chitinispirillaceae bacterium]